MEYKIKVNKDNIYKGILTLFNFTFKLSELEIDLISVMLQNKISTIDTTSREILRKVMNKSKFDINNYIKRLKEKKIILQDDKKLYINPSIITICGINEVTFKFILE